MVIIMAEDRRSDQEIMIGSEEDDFSIVDSIPEDIGNETFSHLEHVNFRLPACMTESQQATENIQTQLQEILKENNELRDALEVNNTVMRAQFKALTEWRDQTMEAHARHKLMIENAHQARLQLEQEKEKLKTSKDELQKKLDEEKVQQAKLQEELSNSLENFSKKESEIGVLREELERQQVSVLHIENQLKESQSENSHFKAANENVTKQYVELLELNDRQKKEFQEEISSLRQSNHEHERVVLALRNELEQVASTNMEGKFQESQALVAELNFQVEKFKNQNSALMEQLDITNTNFQEEISTARHCSRENELSVLALRRKLDQVAADSSSTEGKFQESEAMVTDLKFQIEKLTNQNSALMEQLDITNSNDSSEKTSSEEAAFISEDDLGYSVIHHPGSPFQGSNPGSMERFASAELESKRLIGQQKAQLDEYETQFAESRKQSSVQEALIADQYYQSQKLAGFRNTSSFLQTYDERCQSMGQELGACQERLESLNFREDQAAELREVKSQVEYLTALLEHERTDNQSARSKLEQAFIQMEAQTKEYHRLVANFEMMESDQQTKNRQSKYLTAVEQKKHQEQLDELTAKMVTMEEILQAKEAELKRLKGQIGLLAGDSEQIPILRAQVELYQQDFNTEREMRRKAESDLNQRKQEINSLQVQLMQLTDEITQQSQRQLLEIASSSQQHSLQQQQQPQQQQPPESPTAGVFRMPQSRHMRRRPYNPGNVVRDTGRYRRLSPGSSQTNETKTAPELDSIAHDDEKPMSFECPRCQMTYSTVTAVQNHLDRCLTEDDPPYP